MNAITQDEAGERTCPFAFAAHISLLGKLSAEMLERLQPFLKCRASNCMLWRWADAHDTRVHLRADTKVRCEGEETISVTNQTWRPIKPAERRGHCGLAPLNGAP